MTTKNPGRAKQWPELIYYIYAVASRDNNILYPSAGIEQTYPVQCVPHNNLQAIVSEVPYTHFNRAYLQQKMDDMSWLEEAVRSHASVVNEIHSDLGVVPMRFLTLCRDVTEIENFLLENELALQEALESVSGTSEWGVKLFCDTDRLQHTLLENDTQFRALDERIAELPKGTSFLLSKKKKKLAKESIARICAKYAGDCHSHLESLAKDVEEIAVQYEGHEERSDFLIYNGAFLVSNDRSDAFIDRVYRLGLEFKEQGIEVVHSGPWPPYHFVKSVN